MTVLQAIELFKIEMTNEIFHAGLDEISEDSLLCALDNVYQTIILTYEAEKKNR